MTSARLEAPIFNISSRSTPSATPAQSGNPASIAARKRSSSSGQKSPALARLGPGRVFVTEYPAQQAALARLNSANPEVAARFELVVDGVEIANGYHELGDVAELRRRFLDDCAERTSAGLFCPELDERFLAAMEAGLPDCAGVALGVDRLLMLKMGASSLAEVMPFPVGVA